MAFDITRILLPGEQIITNAGARVRIGFQHEYGGVVTCTSHRLIFTMATPAELQSWWWWSEFGSSGLSSKLLSSELQLRQGSVQTGDGMLSAAATVTVTAKKKANEGIAALWETYRAVPPPEIHGTVTLSPGPDYHCDACGQWPGSSMLSCKVCGRLLDWPRELQPFIDAMREPESLMPDRFANGRETGNYQTLRTVAMFALAAYTQGDNVLLTTMNDWLLAIQWRTPRPASDFRDLPPIGGMGDQQGLDAIWRLARQYPAWLGEDTGPDRDIFKSE